MTWFKTEVPLFSAPFYRYSINLEGRQRNLTFYWNERAGSWHMDVRNADNSAILIGQPLVAHYPIAADYNLESGNMTGYFLMLPDNTSKRLDPEDITAVPQFFTLFYIHEEV